MSETMPKSMTATPPDATATHMGTHDLKTWPVYFEAVINRRKTFELRRADRDFMLGDELLLREFDPATATYTGRQTRRRIRYILRHSTVGGLEDGFVILGLVMPSSTPETMAALDPITRAERIIAAIVQEYGEEVFISPGYGAGDDLRDAIANALIDYVAAVCPLGSNCFNAKREPTTEGCANGQ